MAYNQTNLSESLNSSTRINTNVSSTSIYYANATNGIPAETQLNDTLNNLFHNFVEKLVSFLQSFLSNPSHGNVTEPFQNTSGSSMPYNYSNINSTTNETNKKVTTFINNTTRYLMNLTENATTDVVSMNNSNNLNDGLGPFTKNKEKLIIPKEAGICVLAFFILFALGAWALLFYTTKDDIIKSVNRCRKKEKEEDIEMDEINQPESEQEIKEDTSIESEKKRKKVCGRNVRFSEIIKEIEEEGETEEEGDIQEEGETGEEGDIREEGETGEEGDIREEGVIGKGRRHILNVAEIHETKM